MARKKSATEINKSDEIRQALASNPGKKPREIAALLIAKGVRVSPAYVSTVKFSLRGAKQKRVIRILRRKAAQELSPLTAAVEFIKASGGLESAKAALGVIEEIRRL